MLTRSVMALGLSVTLALGIPATAYAQSAQKATTASVAEKPVVKKKVQKKKSTTTKTTKKKDAAAGKKAAKAEEKKPKGLFATLFGEPKQKKPAKPVAKAVDKKPEPKTKVAPAVVVPVALTAAQAEIVAQGNNGELRSEKPQNKSFMASLFGEEDLYLPETRALDSAMRINSTKRKFQVKPEYEPQIVSFSGYPRGTIVIDTGNHFLYLVEGLGKARRYGIAVGKEGLQYKGSVRVGDKQEWPRWIPTKEMQQREPAKYGRYKDGMPGGGENPLGARAIYLHDGKKDTYLRIHGTTAPQ